MTDSDGELPKAGDLVGTRYRIESLLGQGGMGAVFAAVNQVTGRAVAIKWMLATAARSKESLSRFLAEARATAKIEHPNVIQILDVGEDRGSPFLVMERLRGRSLADRLKQGRLSVSEALNVLIESCRGLAEAHSEGIIHRDVKPDNIFLCEGKDGTPRPPKVLDFGISKLYDEDTGGPSLTKTGMTMGTPWYMSPEQLNAPPEADPRFDVYAMGVVGYECLTGRPPYNAEGLFELVQQIAAGNPTPIRHMSPDVPEDLEAVVMRAMHANRDYRFGNMNEMIAALEAINARVATGAPIAPMTGPVAGVAPTAVLGTGPMNAPMNTPMGHTTPSSGPYPPTGPMMGSTPGYGTSGPVAAPMAQATPKPRSGSNLPLILVGGGILALLGVLGVGGLLAFLLWSGDADDPTVEISGGTTGPVGGGGAGGSTESDNPRAPSIGLTFSGGCAPRFDSRIMVTGAVDSVSVVSTTPGGITGSLQLSLAGINGTQALSTQQRMDNQNAINVMQGQQLWTNMTSDVVAVRSGRIPDPISGSITVNRYDSELAMVDITFQNVTLQSLQNGSICTVNGRLQTNGTTYGQ